ncbi:MAG: FhaA domain-containing protein [Dehalococcoidia bacterium]
MKALARLEAFLQDLMERPASLLTPRRLHPLKIVGALTKELETRAVRLSDRVVIADSYDIALNPEDWRELAGVRETLTAELEEYINRLATERELTLNSPPRVLLRQEPNIRQGEVRAIASFHAGTNNAGRIGDESRTVFAQQRSGMTEQYQPMERPQRNAAPSRQPALVLLGRDGEEAQRFRLDRPALTIGRRSSSEIPIPDLKVSREHARIEAAGTGYYLEDLHSTNGTRVNGRELQGRYELVAGDIIEIGLQRLRFDP